MFQDTDAHAVNRIALEAFEQFRDSYDDWEIFSCNIENMAALAEEGELLVAAVEEEICGAVVYVGPDRKKSNFFSIEGPILRMLVVAPPFRGRGIGRALTEECINYAKRDYSTVVALHTTLIMGVELTMYERMGFQFFSEAPPIFGVPYGIYVNQLSTVAVGVTGVPTATAPYKPLEPI